MKLITHRIAIVFLALIGWGPSVVAQTAEAVWQPIAEDLVIGIPSPLDKN